MSVVPFPRGQVASRGFWDAPDPVPQPVLFAIKAFVASRVQDGASQIAMCLDLHGHWCTHGAFCHSYPGDGRQRIFPDLLFRLAADFSLTRSVCSFRSERGACARALMRRELGVIESFTVESSLGASAGDLLGDQRSWKLLGRHVAEAVLQRIALLDRITRPCRRPAPIQTWRAVMVMIGAPLRSQNSGRALNHRPEERN